MIRAALPTLCQHVHCPPSRISSSVQPIHFAAEGGHREVVAWLADVGADIEATVDDGRRPMHYAAHEGHAYVAVWVGGGVSH